MKQVMNYHKDNGLLNMIRRTDPMINELAGHAIPTIAPPSALDARFDWNAVNAENIIRSEIGMRMRPIDNYARNDWALGSLSKSLGKGYLRVILNVLNSHR